MGDMRIAQADTTGMNSAEARTSTGLKITVDSAEQDYPGSSYTPEWSRWFGFYKTVPELQAVINKYAIWTLGKGYEGKDKEKVSNIRGNGKDTFNDIMFNMVVCSSICGDSFAEIVKGENETLNLKPLNPGTISILTNDKGMITGYEQNVTYGSKNVKKKFKPEHIFHLSWNRLGDEPHGRSTIEKLEDIVSSSKECREDVRMIFRRYVKPLIVTQVDTDDETEIGKFKAKLDNAVKNGENLIIPMGTANMERVSIPQYSTLDPLPWLKVLQEYFIMSEGVPEVILGYGGGTTEATAKVLYLAFQQNIEHRQRYLEQQIKAQLELDIEFNFPADISPNSQEQGAGAGMDAGMKKERDMSNMKEH